MVCLNKSHGGARKVTNGVSTNRVAASFMFCLTEGLLGGTPVNLLVSSQTCQGVPFSPICQNLLLLQRPRWCRPHLSAHQGLGSLQQGAKIELLKSVHFNRRPIHARFVLHLGSSISMASRPENSNS